MGSGERSSYYVNITLLPMVTCYSVLCVFLGQGDGNHGEGEGHTMFINSS